MGSATGGAVTMCGICGVAAPRETLTINQQLVLWVPFAVIFPLLFFHHARSLWLVLDHFFDPASNLYATPPKKTTDG